MNSPQFQRLVLAVLVGLPAIGQAATTLGRSQGVALIGRPLDLSIPIGLDAGTDVSSVCLDADVFYGDARVMASRVTTRIETTGPRAPLLRITTTSTVDEPVVTVYVRVGCTEKLTRRYVLLSEQPGDLGIEAPPVPAAQAGIPRGRPGPAAVAPLPPERAVARWAPAPGAQPAPARPMPQATVRPPAPAARPAPQARLRLEAPDLSIERDAVLQSSTRLADDKDSGAERRAEAAAQWQALNVRPEDLQRTGQRLQALEGDMKLLREALLKDKASVVELRGELERARGERYANPLVYALLALLLGAGVLAAVLWRRAVPAQEPDRDWWRGRGAAAETDFDGDPQSTLRVPSRPAHHDDSAPADLDLSFTESVLDKIQPAAGRAAQGLALGPGELQAVSRAVNAEELSDIQQQADFFMSLGEHEQAIDVLRGHIQAYPEASALTWLDLLEIYYKLQRPAEYAEVRADFQRVFNAEVPSFEAYREQRVGLEAYPSALSRITALWPSRKVLDIIEDSIFRKPGEPGGEAFGLEAYRELLLLHHIGKEVIEGMAGQPLLDSDFMADSQPPEFSHTSIQPLSAALGTSPGMVPFPLELSRIGLDIDLDEPVRPGDPEPSAFVGTHLLDFDLTGSDLPPR